MKKIILSGHTSPETAFVIMSYPYSFTLRCTKRVWLEFKAGKGSRLCSQTSNPKRAGLVWNAVKRSTYGDIAGAMYLDEKGHVQWSALGHYPDAAACVAWLAEYRAGCSPEAIIAAEKFIAMKVNYERAKATGMDYRYAGIVASLATRDLPYEEALARVNVGIQKAAAAAARNVIIEIPAAPEAYLAPVEVAAVLQEAATA